MRCEDEILTIREEMSAATKENILSKPPKQFGCVSAVRLTEAPEEFE